MRLVADHVKVAVPATSANLGPGFDAFGVALRLHDVVHVRATTGATRVEVEGQGAGEVPTGDDHLVVRAIRAGLDFLGAPQAGLELRCVNAIPHGRGLGSSAAAVVAGLVAARALVDAPENLGDQELLALASEFEGHPDNAAPALYGAATIAWADSQGQHAARLPVMDDIATTILVPSNRLATSTARNSLPATVPHADAVSNSARTGLLTLALCHRGDLLLPATADWLHQRYREPVMTESYALVARLREHGHAATISGAGPSVLVLRAGPSDPHLPALAGPQWQVRDRALDRIGARVVAQ
ncbi:MAG: homoserine kinase [Beutenbergiaceae bacterium]